MVKVVEDRERHVVIVGDQALCGWIEDRPCRACGAPRIYYDDFDAYFCAQCDSWLEPTCSDPNCGYCSRRPAKPLSAAPSTQ